MWGFLSESESAVFYRLFIYVLLLEIQLSRVEVWDSTNRSNPTTFVCMSQTMTWLSNAERHMSLYRFLRSVTLYLRWKVFYSFCWNCWPSLSKLSFRSHIFIQGIDIHQYILLLNPQALVGTFLYITWLINLPIYRNKYLWVKRSKFYHVFNPELFRLFNCALIKPD